MSAEGGYGGASASLSLDVNVLDETVNENTNIGESLTEFTIGSEHVPLPIHVKVVPIIEAMAETLWDTSEIPEVRQKKTHLEKALTDYAENKRAHVSDGIYVNTSIHIIYDKCMVFACMVLQYMCVCMLQLYYSSVI